MKDLYEITTIHWTFPIPEDYDALIVSHIWSKKWFNGINVRDKVVHNFQTLRKPTFCLKIDTTLEHRYIQPLHSSEDYIYYGVNNLEELNQPERWGLPKNANKFIFSQLCKLNIPKLEGTILSKEEFYKKYNIDETLKIITFFIGRFKKWHNKDTFKPNICEFFMKNYINIDSFLKYKGYQVIFKLHRCDGQEIKDKYKLDNLIVIDNIDGYETALYSDKAFTACSTVLFELYLYDLPTLDLGNGIYYPGWISQLSRGGIDKLKSLSPFRDLDYGRELIYGDVLNPENKEISLKIFKNKVSQFLEKEFDITKYPFLNRHPIYGNSYFKKIDDVAMDFINCYKSVEKKMDATKISPLEKKKLIIRNKKLKYIIEKSNKLLIKVTASNYKPKVLYVTSFAKDMYHATGKELIESYFDTNQIGKLLVCHENFTFLSQRDVLSYELSKSSFLNSWLEDNKDVIPEYLGGVAKIEDDPKVFEPPNRKASRWFRKIAALEYAYRTYQEEYDYIIWVDSDCIFEKTLPIRKINEELMSYSLFIHIGRRRRRLDKNGETGFVGFNLHKEGGNYLEAVIDCYQSKEYIKYKRWDDGYIFRKLAEGTPPPDSDLHWFKNNKNFTYNDCGMNIDKSSVIQHGKFKNYIYHKKGLHGENQLKILI